MTEPIGTVILTAAGALRIGREDLAYCQVEFCEDGAGEVLDVRRAGVHEDAHLAPRLELGTDVTDPLYWHGGALWEARP